MKEPLGWEEPPHEAVTYLRGYYSTVRVLQLVALSGELVGDWEGG